MSKEDVISYVMTTPNNPNKAILSGMLDSIISASSEGLVLIVEQEEVASSEEHPDGGIQLTYNHSWQEIYDALAQGKYVVHILDMSEPEVGAYNVTQSRVSHASGGGGNEYGVTVESFDNSLPFPNATDKVIVVYNESQDETSSG